MILVLLINSKFQCFGCQSEIKRPRNQEYKQQHAGNNSQNQSIVQKHVRVEKQFADQRVYGTVLSGILHKNSQVAYKPIV